MSWLRNIGKSKAERDAEMATAYVDNELSAAERTRFEARLGEDEGLRDDVETQQALKAAIRALPRLKAPRNFVLNPAQYSKPVQPPLLLRIYPQLRTAAAVMSVLFVLSLSLNLWTPSGTPLNTSRQDSAPADVLDDSMIAYDTMADEAMTAEESVAQAPMAAEPEATILANLTAIPTQVPNDTQDAEIAAEMDEAEDAIVVETVMEEEALLEEAVEEDALLEEGEAAIDSVSDSNATVEIEKSAEESGVAVITATPSPEPISPRATATTEQVRAATMTAVPTGTAVPEIAMRSDTIDAEVSSDGSIYTGENQTETLNAENERRWNLINLLIIVQIILGIVAITLITLAVITRRQFE